MKLSLFGKEKQVTTPERPLDESDAMKGKYQLEDLRRRMDQHKLVPIADVKGGSDDEYWLDTQNRQLSITTDGLGALGKDYPVSPENQVARERLGAITRWAEAVLPDGNKLRRFMAGTMKDSHHTFFNRSVEFNEPEVVLTYKPMMYPGTEPTTTQPNSQQETDRKKP